MFLYLTIRYQCLTLIICHVVVYNCHCCTLAKSHYLLLSFFVYRCCTLCVCLFKLFVCILIFCYHLWWIKMFKTLNLIINYAFDLVPILKSLTTTTVLTLYIELHEVRWWWVAVTFGTVIRKMDGGAARPGPSSLYQM